jgi:hypothetical protein
LVVSGALATADGDAAAAGDADGLTADGDAAALGDAATPGEAEAEADALAAAAGLVAGLAAALGAAATVAGAAAGAPAELVGAAGAADVQPTSRHTNNNPAACRTPFIYTS